MRNRLWIALSITRDQLIVRATFLCVLLVSIQCVAQDAPKLNAALNEQVVMLPIGRLINFAGGFKMSNCQWDLALISAFEKYGRTSKIPTLWFYGDNDSYWGATAEIPTRMYEAYTKSGGSAKLIAFGRFDAGDAHSMFSRREGKEIWFAPVVEFLQQIGLPNK